MEYAKLNIVGKDLLFYIHFGKSLIFRLIKHLITKF